MHFQGSAGQFFSATRGYQVAGAEGIEPPTFGFGNRRSTN